MSVSVSAVSSVQSSLRQQRKKPPRPGPRRCRKPPAATSRPFASSPGSREANRCRRRHKSPRPQRNRVWATRSMRWPDGDAESQACPFDLAEEAPDATPIAASLGAAHDGPGLHHPGLRRCSVTGPLVHAPSPIPRPSSHGP